MFTGIVMEVGTVRQSLPDKMEIAAEKVLRGVDPGDSIAVNGICLTVTAMSADSFTIGIMPETRRRSNLGLLRPGDKVNLEPALGLGGKLGGHLVQGHVDATGTVSGLEPQGGAVVVKIEAPPQIMHYIVEKGFIAMDGMSLTVTDREIGSFRVSIVKYTQENTAIRFWRVGTQVNLEIDIIAKYVEQLTQARTQGITEDFLREHGFSS